MFIDQGDEEGSAEETKKKNQWGRRQARKVLEANEESTNRRE